MVVNKDSMVMKFILFLGLFLLPLIFWPWAQIPFEIPKVWFVQRWIEVLALMGLWKLIRQKLPLPTEKNYLSLTLLVFVFVLLAVLASFLGVDFGKSIVGNFYRRDGLLTLFHLAGFFFFLNIFWENSWKKGLSISIGLGAFLTSIWAVVLGLRLHLLGDLSVYRFGQAIGVTFGQPNFFGGYLLVVLPFSFWLLGQSRSKVRWFWLTAIVCQMIAIFLTFSWGAILGLILLFTAKRLLQKQQITKKEKIFLAIFTLVLLAAIFLVWRPARFNEHFPESRTRIIAHGTLAFLKRPLLGWGWANFDYAFEAVEWPIKFTPDVYVDRAHSNLLEVLVTTGAAGLGVYLAIIILTLKKTWHDKTFFLVLLLFLFHSQTNVISIGEELIFWLVLGIANSGKA